jgi:hypothetical protein
MHICIWNINDKSPPSTPEFAEVVEEGEEIAEQEVGGARQFVEERGNFGNKIASRRALGAVLSN